MGQIDVLNILQENPDIWLSAKEVREKLKDKGHGNGTLRRVTDCLYKLTLFKFIECKGLGLWDHQKLFRVSLKSKNGETRNNNR